MKENKTDQATIQQKNKRPVTVLSEVELKEVVRQAYTIGIRDKQMSHPHTGLKLRVEHIFNDINRRIPLGTLTPIKESFMSIQDEVMKFDPRDRSENPYPSHAKQFRKYHGPDAWIYNPWTGDMRHYSDIGTDVTGISIARTTDNLEAV